MKLIESNSGKKVDATIEKLIRAEINKLKEDERFTFDWSLEIDNNVYKIRLIDKKKVLALMSLTDYPTELRIHINLIESAKEYRGKDTLLKNIPGCLIAFSCQLSFKNGYEGFVSLVPKTELVEYYKKTFGFEEIGSQMAVYYEKSNSIIEKYLGNEKV